MRIKPFTLLKILLLLGFINKQYQLALNYKDILELRQWHKFVLKNQGNYPFAHNNGFPRAYKPSFKSVCQQRHNKEHEKSREFILGALLCKNFI